MSSTRLQIQKILCSTADEGGVSQLLDGTGANQPEQGVCSAHTPELVECTSKGNAYKRQEFGVKLGVAVTNRNNFLVCGLAFP